MMIVRNNVSWYSRVCFLCCKDVIKYLVDTTPCKVEVVRSDGGEEFVVDFDALFTRDKNKQELTTASTPEQNDIAKRQIAVKEAAGLAARTHASER